VELANTFYIVGIICMSLITIILIALIIVAIAIKVKITHIHNQIEARIRPIKEFADTAVKVVKVTKDAFTK